MPDRKTIEAARRDKAEGKSPSVQAGEFVREEIHKIRRGEHGARSPEQAIAIGLSEARRAGVDLPPPAKGKVSERTRKSAEYAYKAGQGERQPRHSERRSRAIKSALKREPRSSASHEALSEHAREAAARRTPAERSAAAKRAAKTKGPTERRAAARKAAQTRASERK
ncbi:MAG: DUF6496 domain-containing protein [Phycisphaerales bacterium]